MNYFKDIRSKFGLPISSINTNGHFEYQYKCPFCIDRVGSNDKSGHLFVRSDNGVYHCYRCDASGIVIKSKHDISPDNSELIDQLQSYLNTDNVSPNNIENEYSYTIPRKKIFDNSIALSYMRNRGFSDEELDFYDVRVGDIMTPLINRVVIPNKIKNKIYTDMYVARTYVNDSKRYLNPPTSKSGIQVFNLFRIPENSDRIIICEGPITAMAAGKNAVALYGKSINPLKLRLIVDKNPKEVVVNLDPDAEHIAVELANKLKMINPDLIVKLCINPDSMKDAADYKKLGRINEYLDMINNSIVFDNLIYTSLRSNYKNE